jgi:TolA-binding protein
VRLELSVQAYQNGANFMGSGRYAEAAEAFRESLRLKEEGSHTPAVRYNLAKALRALGRSNEAQTYASAVMEQTIDKDLQDDAAFLLSQCAEDIGNYEDAKNALRTLLRRWPRSSFAQDASRRLSELNLRKTPKHDQKG